MNLSALWRWVASARLQRRLFSTPAILLLAVGIMWGTWSVDLRHGDTANYYRRASQWLKAGPIDQWFLSYSPIYTVYFAAVQKAFPDPGAAMFVHRALIVLMAAAALLALFRRILPRPWAWLVVAWWVALPINWRAEYEVHYFSFIFIALAGALAGGRSPWVRGLGLGVVAVLALLLRNEFFPAVALFGACCALAAWRNTPGKPVARLAGLAPVLAPALVLCAACAWLLSGGPKHHPWRNYRAGLESRHRINLVQVYPLGYVQRRDDWKGDPWFGGWTLMQRDFRQRTPTFREALQANPGAIWEHVRWNLSLIPAGLQLGLFARYGNSPAPDFAGRPPDLTRNPWPLTAATLVLWAMAAWLLVRWWRRRHRFFLRGSPAPWVWLFLLCCLPTVAAGIITQRPRPNYIFPLLILLMAFTGLSARLVYGEIRRRLRLPTTRTQYFAPAVAVLLFVLLSGRNFPIFVHQPDLDSYHRLKPFKNVLTRKRGVLVTNEKFSFELGSYHGLDQANKHRIHPWAVLMKKVEEGNSFGEALAAAEASEVYLKDLQQLPPAVQAWRAEAASAGWQRLGGVEYAAESWEFWSRPVVKPAEEEKSR